MSQTFLLLEEPGERRLPVSKLFRKFDAGIVVLRRRRRERAELRRLLRVGRHIIADVGLGYEAALAEARKPFWEA